MTNRNISESLAEQIRQSTSAGKTNMGTTLIVWKGQKIEDKLAYGFRWMLQTVKAVLRVDRRRQHPNQLEMHVNGEPLPIERVPLAILRGRVAQWRCTVATLNQKINITEAEIQQRLAEGEGI